MHFIRLTLNVSDAKFADVARFYNVKLGAAQEHGDSDFTIGRTTLAFEAVSGNPFYHFAFLMPGDRFDAAFQWARMHLALLPDKDTGEFVFELENWTARAFYFHDPAGNIVELIAHNGVGETGVSGNFDPRELLGLSEIGLVGKRREVARCLRTVGLRLCAGGLTPGRLAFVGERAKVLILAEAGRGWLPTGRPAEVHPVDVMIAGMPLVEIVIGAHRIRTCPD